MNEQMEFPETWEEYEQEYGFNDSDEVYTNNSRLIQSFRVKQWLDHLEQEPCDDMVSREDLEECKELMTDINGDTVYAVRMSDIRRLPSVKPQPKTGHWITVTNGIPLSKGHGRILDEKDILDTENNDGGWYDLVDLPDYIAGVPEIVEADKESEEV